MMKTACLFLFASSATAFTTPVRTTTTATPTALFATSRPDSSKAVAAALEASKKYGATSPEARVAWEAVEDMDSADNSAATVATLDQECDLTDEQKTAACEDYAAKMEELKSLVGDFQMSKFDKMKALTSELSNLKLAVESTSQQKDSPELRLAVQKAMAAAKQTTEEFGAGSDEAKMAWETVEEVASSGLGNAVGPRLDEECLVDAAMEACMALEELNRALKKANLN